MLYQENTFLNIIKNYKKNPYEIIYNKSFSRWIAWLKSKQVTSVQCNIDSLYFIDMIKKKVLPDFENSKIYEI